VFRRLLCCSLNKPIDAAAMDHNATQLTPSAEAADTGTTVGGQTDQPKTPIRRDLGKLNSTFFTFCFVVPPFGTFSYCHPLTFDNAADRIVQQIFSKSQHKKNPNRFQVAERRGDGHAVVGR
jgi:hypothetical protein